MQSKLYWVSLALHMAAGISVGLVYTYYYSSNDTWLFFQDATTMSAYARENFMGYVQLLFDFSYRLDLPGLITFDFRSLIFIKLLSIICFLTGDNYWICTCYFSLLSFVAAWYIHRTVMKVYPDAVVPSSCSFLFFPSVIFWSSGIEKETLSLISLYFLSAIGLKIAFNKRVAALQWVLCIVAGIILWALKYYWAGVFSMALATAVIVYFLIQKNSVAKKYQALIYFFVFIASGIGASFLHPNFNLDRFFHVLVANHEAFVTVSRDSSLIHFNQLSPEIFSIIMNAPWALVSGLFRPFAGEGQGLLGLCASLENLFLLILFISTWWNVRQRLPISLLFLTVANYCAVLCIFLALSTPNFGTLSRYRVGFLPFFIFLVSYRNPLVDFLARKVLK
ncbi:hypothetical protein WSM22_13100 [Cytophagales bacterium WSM2-2]|nr:hypothetical protein WSM22_13100 [Cytophagales bacterium WSM2-2]